MRSARCLPRLLRVRRQREVFLGRAEWRIVATLTTNGLLLGLVITLAVVLAYASYITIQLAGLRKLQSEMVDRNRKDSLQLLRVQNDLNSIALGMRDMLDTTEPYPLTAWMAQFDRIHQDLDNGLKLEENLAGANRTPDQRRYLSQSVAQFGTP